MVVVYFKVLTLNLPKRTGENYEKCFWVSGSQAGFKPGTSQMKVRCVNAFNVRNALLSTSVLAAR
jgi:hypothetical protein